MQVQFENTPKAFANFSPGFERSENPGIRWTKFVLNPERVPLKTNPFRVGCVFNKWSPGLSLRSNPGLGLANAFGVLDRTSNRSLFSSAASVGEQQVTAETFLRVEPGARELEAGLGCERADAVHVVLVGILGMN